MATFTATEAATTTPPKQLHAGVVAVHASHTFAAAPALNDVVEMVRIPAGATVIDLQISSTDLDTNGAPAVVLDVGDGGDTDRFIDGSTIGQTGGHARLGAGVVAAAAGGALGHKYVDEDTIDVLVQVGPATGAVGTIELIVTYSNDA